MTATSDVLIIGGGVILAIALNCDCAGYLLPYLVVIYAAATQAAAGMLAPQAEAIPKPDAGFMPDFAIALSRLDWLEELSGEPTGYWPCGILAPVYEEANDRQARGNQEEVSYWLTGMTSISAWIGFRGCRWLVVS